MKCLVTGMTSRQANPDASVKDVTFAHLLAEALRHGGHEVEHRDPLIEEDLSDFDHAFVGLAPLHGLGANRMYGGLAVILRMWPEMKLSLYTDDPDMSKVISGINTMHTKPERFTKPFFAYKKEHDVASRPEVKEWLETGVAMLNSHPWPRLIVPAFSWYSEPVRAHYAHRVPLAQGRIVPLDLTAFIDGEDMEPYDLPAQQWITEAPRDDKWLSRTHPQLPIYRLGTKKSGADDKRPPDAKLLELYNQSQGLLHHPVDPVGFWHSRIELAAKAGTVFTTRWQDVVPLGDHYTVLPANVDDLDMAGRLALIAGQREALRASTPDREVTASVVSSIMDPAVVEA